MSNPWNEYVLPRMTDRLLRTPTVGRYRQEVASSLSGDIVEIGFGSGLNVPYYPAAVTGITAIEPSQTARRLAVERVETAGVSVEFLGVDGQDLPIASGTMDGALSTFTLCTIPDAAQALDEIFRVLKPGGQFAFLEHGVCPDSRVRKWQNRLNPLQRRTAGGRNLARSIDHLIESAGFSTVWMRNTQMPGPAFASPWGYLYLGVSTKPE